MSRKSVFSLLFLVLTVALLAACSTSSATPGTSSIPLPPVSSGDQTLYFVMGSENEAVMQNIVQPWFKQQGWTANYTKLGSVDQKILLQSGQMVDSRGVAFNVMWLANKA
jgi:ABC-type glycerol-3-phosphate transport system substrate-binding protein